MRRRSRTSWLSWGAIALGVGLAGFFDGIVMHQILQWHHMVSHTDEYPMTTLAGLEANTLADGLFHVFAYTVTIVGLALVWGALGDRTGPWSTRRFIGFILLGWASFNLIEGVINHHILQIHRVRDDVADPWPWDVGFLAINAVILLVAWRILSHTSWSPEPPGADPHRDDVPARDIE